MPRVEVVIDVPGREPEAVMTERVPAELLESEHFATQLMQRVGWALEDAEKKEQAIHA
jgi:hypothetical protein